MLPTISIIHRKVQIFMYGCFSLAIVKQHVEVFTVYTINPYNL